MAIIRTHSMEHEDDLDWSSDDGIIVLGYDEASNRFIINDKSLDLYSDSIQPTVTTNKSAATNNTKKPPPIYVVATKATTIQNILNSILTSRKVEIKLMRIGIKRSYLSQCFNVGQGS